MVTLTVNLSNESASRLFAKDPLRMTDLSGCGLSASASSHLRHNPVTLGIHPFLPCQGHLLQAILGMQVEYFITGETKEKRVALT